MTTTTAEVSDSRALASEPGSAPGMVRPTAVWRGPGVLALVLPFVVVDLVGGAVVTAVLGPLGTIPRAHGLGALVTASLVLLALSTMAAGFGLNAAVAAMATQAQGLRPTLLRAWQWSGRRPRQWARTTVRLALTGLAASGATVVIGLILVMFTGTATLSVLGGIAAGAIVLQATLPGWLGRVGALLLDEARTTPVRAPAGVRAPTGRGRLHTVPVVVGGWSVAAGAGVVEQIWLSGLPGTGIVPSLLAAVAWMTAAMVLTQDALVLVRADEVPGLPRVGSVAGHGSTMWVAVAGVLCCLHALLITVGAAHV